MPAFTLDPQVLRIGASALAAGLLLGTLVTWLVGRSRRRRLEAEIAALGLRIKDQDEIDRERDAAFAAATNRLTAAFSELAQRSLEANSRNFLRMAEQNLGAQHERAKSELSAREQAVENLVKPIRDALQRSQQQIEELEKARSQAYGSITSQLESMQKSQALLAQETQNLVNALRRPQVRGRWGEITLRRLVEIAGMVEHCDFNEQVQNASEERVIRPDMIVRMPDQRELVVDVKTPLDAYLEAMEAKDDTQQKLALQRHARNLREHIRKLASKAYWDQFQRSPDFVILFIPGDQFLGAALNEDPDLIEAALAQQIILATPTSFVALLKAVAYGWRQVVLAKNAEEVQRLARELYNRLGVFVGHLDNVGRQLTRSVENYNRAVGSLERSVLPGARKFVELGVRPKKELDELQPIEALPRSMIDAAAENEADLEEEPEGPGSDDAVPEADMRPIKPVSG